MYHPNYPPQMPNQAPLGYPPVSSHHGPPQHIPPNHQMPGNMIPPHSVNSQLNQSQQMIPPNYSPNYSPMQHTDKLQQQQKAQQQLTAAKQQQQQQNQMYMRPPNLMQSSGKPASYQSNAYPMVNFFKLFFYLKKK